jgi:F0F1-type ATP synthase membrane subunit b/b'
MHAEELVLGGSFLICVSAAIFFVGRKVTSQIDAYYAQVNKELEESDILRKDAIQMLEEYRKKYKDLQDNSAIMIKEAQQSVDDKIAQAKLHASQISDNKINAAMNNISKLHEQAVIDVRKSSVKAATEVAIAALKNAKKTSADPLNIANDISRVIDKNTVH